MDFVQVCAGECQNYVALLTYSEDHLEGAAPYVRSLVQSIDAQSALPLLLSAYAKFSPAQFTDVVQWLLLFATRWSILLGFDSSGLETLLFDLARSIREVPNDDEKAKTTKLRQIKETLKKSAPSDEQIEASVERLILPSDGAEYVVRKLADAMESKTKEKTTGRESNLEHIYPQNPEEKAWGGEANQAKLRTIHLASWQSNDARTSVDT